MWKQQLVYQHTQTAAQWTLTHCAHSFLPRIMSPRSPSLHLCLTRMSVSVHNLSVCHPLRRGTSWPSMAATGRKLTCSTSRQTSRWGVCLMRGRNKSAAEWSVLECVRVLFSVCCHVCARWVALSSPGLSAGSVGFGAECDVAADPLSCGSLSISLSLSLSVPVSLRVEWWRTFRSAVEASWGSSASGAAWAWEMPPWSEILVVSLIHTDAISVALLWLFPKALLV